ncbi:colanic acid undecaprenyl disphosphate flippase WzxC [Bowmanella denitrificans]|uniref:Colanic acid undecaprenyl disphosphate flippase WzxC n=1 Tax=Bowmanella denitrificans TaxID=366582 RepID=A0ABP3GWN0_9ALTE
MNLFNRAKKGLAWNSLGTLLKSALGLAQIALLSRFFSAEELGTYSQFFLVYTLSLMLVDFGLTTAAINRDQLTEHEKRQLGLGFIGNGLLISVALFVAAPALGALLNNPLLATILPWYTPALLIMAVGNYAAMECQKTLNFSRLVLAETLASVIGFTFLTVALLNGFGVYSFILSITINHLVRTGMLLVVHRQLSWRLWELRISQLSAFYRYGGHFTGANLLSFLVTSLDILLISRFLGVEKTGQYGLIKDLVFRIATLLNPVLTRVALPFYAKMQGYTGLGSIYCRVKELLCYLTVPIYSFFIMFPELSINALLGEKWLHLSVLLQLLAGWMIIRSVMSQSGSLLSAIGWVRQAFVWNIFIAVLVPLVIWFGTQSGIKGVATALLVMQLSLYLPHWYFLLRPAAAVSVSHYLLALALPLLTSILTLSFVEMLLPGESNDIGTLLIALVMAAPIYMLLASFRLKHLYLQLKTQVSAVS